MLARSGQVQPTLTFTKFAPAHPDKAIKWAGAQIWLGPGRTENGLIADCIDEEWAKSLASAYNDSVVMTGKVSVANQVLKELLGALADAAQGYKKSDPQLAESLTTLVATYRAQAKKGGLSPV